MSKYDTFAIKKESISFDSTAIFYFSRVSLREIDLENLEVSGHSRRTEANEIDHDTVRVRGLPLISGRQSREALAEGSW